MPRTYNFYTPRRKNKYGNEKVTVDGVVCDSKKEARRFAELNILQRGGIIKNLERQVKFELIPKQADERAVSYYADFVYEEIDSGKKIVEDVKSVATRKDKVYVIKRKLFKARYGDYTFREI